MAGHAFENVDRAPRPAEWVRCLDALHREPFYLEYKRRVQEILAPRALGLYLEVGSGAGTDALATGAAVIGLDRSLTMCREARARGLSMAIAGDAEALPLLSGVVDGCWSDRTFQHIRDPDSALAELVRVMKGGASIVVVDPDYGTQTLAFPDALLARKVLNFRAEHAIRNGRLAHRMGRRFSALGLHDVRVEERRLVVTEPTAVDNVMGLRSWARSAMGLGLMSSLEVERWETLYDEVANGSAFRWAVSFFITSGRKP